MTRSVRTARRRRVVGAAALVAAVVAASTAAVGPATQAADGVGTDVTALPDLHLVTLTGPGTAGGDATRTDLLAQQQRVLADIDAAPVYRWTTALNGFVARLDPDQVQSLAGDRRVALVEPNAVRPTAGRSSAPSTADRAAAGGRGAGSGVVIGFVDSGLSPDLPVFTDVPSLGRPPADWRGRCVTGEDWSDQTCQRKIVGADWFVTGFGRDRLRSSEVLSPRDGSGHGTRVAALAAGNAGVTVRLAGDAASGAIFSGVAPRARIAVYKACWTAPDPTDDGCATADLVSAVDRAVTDGVDVLNLSVAADAGPEVDTLDRALLGAAESDTVVVAAAGNTGRTSYAAHAVPWVTTVGAVADPAPRTRASAVGGPTWTGAGRSARPVRAAEVVLGRDIPAPDTRRADAAQCRPGSLDAGAAADAVVVCERGGTGRVDKSATVAAARGVGMVLVNNGPGSVDADLHGVPTVHLDAGDGAALRRWVARTDDPRLSLRPAGATAGAGRVPSWSPEGDPRGGVLKPDLVAPASGLLTAGAESWELLTGTSAAAAQVSGTAAAVTARTGWDAARVRSSLTTTASPVAGTATRVGAGRLAPRAVARLVLDEQPSAYRAVLAGRRAPQSLNLASVMLGAGRASATRTVTNTGPRAEYFSASVRGLRGVGVTPAAMRLDPGERGTFTVRVTGDTVASDGGAVVWRGARGSEARIPVLLSR